MAPPSVLSALHQYRSFLIVSHCNPDGDSVSSQLALARMLSFLGKSSVVMSKDPVPQLYQFLPGAESIQTMTDVFAEPFECIAVLDSSNPSRTGLPPEVLKAIPVINIDHHCDNRRFGAVNLVDPQASSCSELVDGVRKRASLLHDAVLATLLFAGIYSDTGGFRFSNTSASALRICAELMDEGADFELIVKKIFNSNSLGKTRLRGAVLSSASLHFDGRVCLFEMPAELLEQYNANPEDTEGLSDEALRLTGVEVGVFARYYDSRTKFNLRSTGLVNVGEIARLFGGGGHAEAASCILDKSGKAALANLLSAIEERMSQVVGKSA